MPEKRQYFAFYNCWWFLIFKELPFFKHRFHILGISEPILKVDQPKGLVLYIMMIEHVYGAIT